MESLEKMMKDTELNIKGHTHDDAKTFVDEPKLAPGGSLKWKRLGNEHLAFKRYNDAIFAYTKGIEEGDSSIDMLANRSCAYLHLLKYKCALADAEAALKIDKYHIKCIYRKVKALFGLALYRDALTFLKQNQLDSIPKNDLKVITDLMTEVNRYIAQSENAHYPWNDIYTGQSTYLDMADYTNLVVVKEAPMKGRGLFATKMIKAGKLVLANKAFAYVENDCKAMCSCSSNVKYGIAKIQDQLLEKIYEILKKYPEKFEAVGRLYAGPELGYLKSGEAMYNEVDDSERVELITWYNSIKCSQRIDGSPCINAGLWIISSFINHSCVDANCSWTVIGDFLFVRAVKDIAEGEEIEMVYKTPNILIAQEQLDQYDFICECRLCKRDRLDDATVKASRTSLLSQLTTILNEFDDLPYDNFRKHHDVEIQRLIDLFDRSRQDAPELNLCLVDELFEFGKIRLGTHRFSKSIAIFEKVYNLIENVAGFQLYTVLICIKMSLAYTLSNEKILASSWIDTLKKKTRLFFGTLHILHVQFSQYITTMRQFDLDI